MNKFELNNNSRDNKPNPWDPEIAQNKTSPLVERLKNKVLSVKEYLSSRLGRPIEDKELMDALVYKAESAERSSSEAGTPEGEEKASDAMGEVLVESVEEENPGGIAQLEGDGYSGPITDAVLDISNSGDTHTAKEAARLIDLATAEDPFDRVSLNKMIEAFSADQLRKVGEYLSEASNNMTDADIKRRIKENIKKVGVANPNSHSMYQTFFEVRDGLTMQAGHSYRSVDIRAIKDLADTGIVRGSYMATDGKRSNTSGPTTYWSDANPGKKHQFASPGHFIIEASTESLDNGLVTIHQIIGVYGRGKDGNAVKVFAPMPR